MTPISPPIEPMLAKLAAAIPEGDGWLFEPKWDGFRALAFRDGSELYLQSRELKPLNRYFPDLAAPLLEALPERCVVDGEIVIAGAAGLDFEALLLRIHPAASRVKLLSQETPASMVLFDLLALGDEDLRATPLSERRALLERSLREGPSVHVTPATQDRALAEDWFARFEGAGLDGVIAKRLDSRYEPGVRAMVKVKHARTADCVVGGFRWHKNGRGSEVGSLLLGLYDREGKLQHAGVCSGFSAARRRELAGDLHSLREGAMEEHPWRDWAEWAEEGGDPGMRLPGAKSRWNQGKDLTWEPVRPERVCEVAYDHLQGDRFRHATRFVRWRTDRSPEACRYDQLEVTPPYELSRILGTGQGRDGS